MAEPTPLDFVADAARLAARALAEDGSVDLTTECTVADGRAGLGVIECRERAVLAGRCYGEAVARACGLQIEWAAGEGEWMDPGSSAGRVGGPLAQVLRVERPLLNFLQRACGIATMTRAFTDALRGTACRVLHTRKTAPGLRGLDVAAVLAGGGELHRAGLDTAVLIKDNHWRSLELEGRALLMALDSARRRGCTALYVEVTTESQVAEACRAGATRLLVDNQDPETLGRWAALARRLSPGMEIEATGGITLANVRDWAAAGADFVSVGALTHSVRAIDLALKIDG
ncbi:MAG: carboxylating nicotinate-nucleotide diphosphorylase [Gemmatimonadetes bacterium]|nr:carboxylating nicotinate-nucleotide diphosphorylase [Gemmatimonadota bacterium]